ncbi:MAG TPA: ABC transporter substrate-binding protein, partial [Treponemataceae bacterium]|nr:ABC transporter substrate-binding protein [Treponemataceae bacterium]
MKNSGRLILGFLLVCLVMPAWTGGNKDKSKETVQEPKVTEITIWDFKYGDAAGVQPVMKKIDDLIMKNNPNIKINHVGQANDNYYQLVTA